MDWLEILRIDLIREFPNRTIVDAQKGLSVARALAINYGKPQCSAEDYYDALGIPTSKAHNAGYDAVFELQAYIAEFCLTDEQFAVIQRGGVLPRIDRSLEEVISPAPPQLTEADFPVLSALQNLQQLALASDQQPADANTQQPATKGRKGKKKYQLLSLAG